MVFFKIECLLEFWASVVLLPQCFHPPTPSSVISENNYLSQVGLEIKPSIFDTRSLESTGAGSITSGIDS